MIAALPGAGVVPPPPPPPPPPPTATPAQLAQANALERQIAAQSTVLDQLADRYNAAHLAALAAAQQLASTLEQETTAQANEASAQTDLRAAHQNLHRTALDAYLGVKLQPDIADAQTPDEAYQLEIARVYSGTALVSAAQRVRDLHTAERQVRDVESQVAAAASQARTEAAGAASADQQAQTAADLAAAQQNALLATLNTVQGDMAALVAGQKAALAVAAYYRLTQTGMLLFTPSGPLPAQLPETAAAIKEATSQIGKPYVWGAAGPNTFDCSGLMQWSWAQAGIVLPRVAADQQAWAIPVPISQVQPGDLVFFGSHAHHVGMYVGNGLMVEAPHTGATVDLTPIWWSDLAGFGRVHA